MSGQRQMRPLANQNRRLSFLGGKNWGSEPFAFQFPKSDPRFPFKRDFACVPKPPSLHTSKRRPGMSRVPEAAVAKNREALAEVQTARESLEQRYKHSPSAPIVGRCVFVSQKRWGVPLVSLEKDQTRGGLNEGHAHILSGGKKHQDVCAGFPSRFSGGCGQLVQSCQNESPEERPIEPTI